MTSLFPRCFAALGLALVLAASVRAQAATADRLTLPSNLALTKKLEAVRDYLHDEDWTKAVKLLQSILDSKDDGLVQVTKAGADGKPGATVLLGARSEANRILAGLPRPAVEAYEVAFGPTAQNLLDVARKENDPQLYDDVAQRFFYTKAGNEAAVLLAAYHLDRANYLSAALYYERLLARPAPAPLTLFKAAVAFHGLGDQTREEQTWKQLAAVAPDGIDLNGKRASLEQLRRVAANLTG